MKNKNKTIYYSFQIIAATLLTIVCPCRGQELLTIYAEGGEGTNYDWEKVRRIESVELRESGLAQEGYLYYYNDCAQYIETYSASSTLSAMGSKSYDIKNLTDVNPTTAWVEGSEGFGVGDWFEIKSKDLNIIFNGYQASPTVWRNNARVKKLKVYKDNHPLCYLILKDEMGRQYFELPGKETMEYEVDHVFRFEIVDAYPGAKWQDVAISEIEDSRCCFSENTKILSNDVYIGASDIEKLNIIQSIDLIDTTYSLVSVAKTTTQKHVKLLSIKTKSKQIEITPEHPLYIEGHGFASIQSMLKNLKLSDYTELINRIAFLTWDESKKTLQFETLQNIEVLKGLFNTYSILELNKGTTFVANGFITKAYK
ncbi:MAG: hypothetical protein RLZ10_2463 [Bacteroidota bacterium]|jgi:hypothetical protein